MLIACLVDTTRCVGCRSCQVACKRAHQAQADKTRFFAKPGGLQNPGGFTSRTRTYISFHELQRDDGPCWVFAKHQCLHCAELRCAVACPPQIFSRSASGIVSVDADACLGCGACIDTCPLAVPAIDYWDTTLPQVRKCDFCIDRQESPPVDAALNGRPLSAGEAERLDQSLHAPACVQACPAGALEFGPRDALLVEARRRIAAEPGRYIDHVYGETELGGTSWLYLSAVPFEQLGLPTRFAPFGQTPQFGANGVRRRFECPPSLHESASDRGAKGDYGAGIPLVLTGLVSRFFRRRDEVRRAGEE